MENIPTDYVNGTDFRLSKTTKGQYADYSTSKWARKETSLTEEQLKAVDEFGLFDLKSFLPKKPGEEELLVIKQMFEASVDGELYDPEKWGNYYRPAGMQLNTTNVQPASAPVTSAPAPSAPATSSPASEESVASETSSDAVVQSVSESNPEPTVENNASASSNKSTQDILDMIRNRSTES